MRRRSNLEETAMVRSQIDETEEYDKDEKEKRP
jgi:hypothetical protein